MVTTTRKTACSCLALISAVLMVAGGEVLARRVVTERKEKKPPDQVQSNVVILSRRPLAFPEGSHYNNSLLLIGNSHTYALPGLRRGDNMRPDSGQTLIFELEKRLGDRSREGQQITYLRLSQPNFLPFEILTSVGALLQRGIRPTVVVLGLTWRNIARDSRLRQEIHETYRDSAISTGLQSWLSSPEVAAAPGVLHAVEAELRAVAHQLEQERTKSHADALDDIVSGYLGKHVALVGESASLRARIYRPLNYFISDLLVPQGEKAYVNDVITTDLEFNLECIHALLRLLRAVGADVVCYVAPQRSDVPPVVDTTRMDEVFAKLRAFALDSGCTWVDTHSVVPNQYWGWEENTPDRSHFTEPGHQLLAKQIVEGAGPSGAWQRLGAQ